MATVTLLPYWKAKEGKLAEVKALCPSLVDLISNEKNCTYVSFAFKEDTMLVREGYEGAAGVLEHLDIAGPHFGPLFDAADLQKLEVIASAEDIKALQEPLKDLNPTFYSVEF
ncbi:MAG: hypothetical protein PQJ58_04765 [Spirochaetales bacterium]|nr:hypothetical protein [Spirochaetales bacterium]